MKMDCAVTVQWAETNTGRGTGEAAKESLAL